MTDTKSDIAESISALFSKKQRLQDWIDIEAALAECQASMGIIPEEAAKDIAANADIAKIDIKQYDKLYRETKHPLVPLLKLYKEVVGPSGEYLHFGATTHDVVDIAKLIALKKVWDTTEAVLLEILDDLLVLIERHAHTLMAGRSHNIQALPITFGFKAAVWADELYRSVERLRESHSRVFVVTFSGANGTMASFEGKGEELEARMGDALGLGTPEMSWHPARDRIAEIACIFAMVGGSLGRIAQEVYLLMGTELRELSEGYTEGLVGSSTMPHKLNPMNSQHIMGDSRTLRYCAAHCLECMHIDHEHNLIHFDDELTTCERMGVTMGDLLERSKELIHTLYVDEKHMRKNLDLLQGAMMSENVMMGLGKRIGKMSAKDVVSELSIKAVKEELPLADLLKADHRVADRLTTEEIDALLDPMQYAESAARLAEKYAEKLKNKLKREDTEY